jgi:hypothetical protein
MPGTSEPPETKSLTYWMDVWVPAHAPVRRVRVEAQLNIGDDWIIYPMEMRIQSATVPVVLPTGALPPVIATSVESAFGPLQGYLCGKNEKPVGESGTVRDFIRRNAAQDIALARKMEPSMGRESMEATLSAMLDASDAKAWCASRGASPPKVNPETYLKLRDYLFKTTMK